jgi:tol-pal system protein YbgF
MKPKYCFCLLIVFLAALPSARAGTKEEVVRLQSDVLQLQNQIREFEKTFSEKMDGLKSLVVQLNDAVASTDVALKQISSILQNQASGVRSADQSVLQEIRALSLKIDDSATSISALAQQLNDLKVQYNTLNQQEASAASLSPDAMYSQAMRDFVQGNFDMAIEEFTAYIGKYPGGDKAAAALCNIGEAYHSQKQLPQAISAFTRVINDYPNTDSVASALYKRAMLELEMQEKDNAIADFRSVIEKYADSPEAGMAQSELEKIVPKPPKPSRTVRRKSR